MILSGQSQLLIGGSLVVGFGHGLCRACVNVYIFQLSAENTRTSVIFAVFNFLAESAHKVLFRGQKNEVSLLMQERQGEYQLIHYCHSTEHHAAQQ